MRKIYNKVKSFVERHEDRLDTVAFVGGFAFDILTLKMADSLLDNLIVLFYLLVASVGILVINMYFAGNLKRPIFEKIVLWIPFIIQFSFGGVLSVLVVFYAKSANFISSWPFMLILFAIFVGNEKFRARYTRIAFQISVLYFLLFLLLIFYVPMLVGKMGSLVFLMSGMISLVLIAGFIKLIDLGRPGSLKKFHSNIAKGVAIIFVGINILYFTNIIPPIPLSLRDVQIFQNIKATRYGYTAIADTRSDCRFCLRPKIHLNESGTLYAYSSIFAPITLSTSVVHEWQQYDSVSKNWIVRARVPFSIRGGRAEGFRGYSLKSNITPGRWRLSVETSGGQTLGRITFDVLPYDSQTKTEQKDL